MAEAASKLTPWNVMPETEKLYWKDGHSNLIEWKESLHTYARLYFSEEIVQVLIQKSIPRDWLREFELPLIHPVGKLEISLMLEERTEHNKNHKNWINVKGKLTSFVTLAQTDSSRLRLDKYHEQVVKDHILNCEVLEILDLIEKTHTFSGAVSGFDDQEAVTLEWHSFKPEGGENLEVYTNRYQRLIRKVENTGATVETKTVIYRYLKGLKSYNKSALVQLNVMSYLAVVDKPGQFPENFALLIEELQGYDQAENPVGTKQSNSNRFAVQQLTKQSNKRNNENNDKSDEQPEKKAKEVTFKDGSKGQRNPDGTFQVFLSTGGMSKKFKKGSEKYNGLLKPSHVSPTKNTQFRGKGNDNVHMKAFVERKIAEAKAAGKTLTEGEVYKSTKCNHCDKYGHLSKDCKLREESNKNKTYTRSVQLMSRAEVPVSESEKRNTSGFFSCNMTAMSKVQHEDEIELERQMKLKNYNYANLDGHANIHVWCNDTALKNIRKVKPIKVKGFGGFSKFLDTVGDHPLLGEVFVDKENGYNIISCDLVREDQGYFRRVSKDNKKEYLYNDDLKSVLTFERDPVDGFYKISLRELNRELIRVFPNLCMSVS